MESRKLSNDVAVIGAGMAGLSCARHLAGFGVPVQIFDKSRGIGGRLATRRRPAGRWNHGAPRVQARREDFVRMLRSLCAAGSAEQTAAADGAFAVCGYPDMRSLLEPLAAELKVRLGAAVEALQGGPGAWRLSLEDGREFGPFAAVVLAIPAPQAQQLLGRSGIPLASCLAPVEMSPRWTLLLGFSGTVDPAPAIPVGPVLASLARHRPGGAGAERPAFAEGWVVHATRAWSVAHLELAREDAARQLLLAVAELTAVEPDFAAAHRWRYALTERPLGASHVWLAGSNIGLCGDWCLGDRAEHAFESGVALAARLCQSLKV